MLTKEQLKILGVFNKGIFDEFTFKQIKEKSRQKSNNIVQIALKEFQKEGIIKTKKIDLSVPDLIVVNSSYCKLVIFSFVGKSANNRPTLNRGRAAPKMAHKKI